LNVIQQANGDDHGFLYINMKARFLEEITLSRKDLVKSPTDVTLYRTYFNTNEYRWELLNQKQEKQASFKLTNVKLYPEYLLLNNIDALKKIVDTKPHNNRDWLPASMTIIEASIGCRFSESLVVKFEISTQPTYPSNLWIIQTGVFKDGADVTRKYSKALRAWTNKGNSAESFVLTDIEKKQLNMINDMVIPRPVLYREKGINPEYIINLIKLIRKRVWEIYALQNMWVPGVNNAAEGENWLKLQFNVRDVGSRREFTEKLIQNNSRFLRSFLGKDSILLQDNVSHSFRKLYASYSYELMGSGTQQSYWFMNLLGHKNISASFNYMNLAVKMGLKVNETDVSKLLEIIANIKTDSDKIKLEMNSRVQTEEKLKTALPGIEDDFVYIRIDPLKYKRFDTD
jgi:hypothetical protein